MFAALAVLSAAAVSVCYSNGWLLYYGDAEAHLNIARRMVDSRTPGYDQVGTVWLPLPHWLMLPFVRVDALVGATVSPAPSPPPSPSCWPARSSTRRPTASSIAVPRHSPPPRLFALNPNVLYLQSIPMTESLFFACLLALLYFTVRFRDTQGWGAVMGAGIAACAATLTRYDGWFLLPFVAVYFLHRRPAQSHRRRRALQPAGRTRSAIRRSGTTGGLPATRSTSIADPTRRAPFKATPTYPGRNDWREAFLYYRTAAQLCAGPCLPLIALAGAVAALFRRAFWPLLLLALPGVFYVWSMRFSGGTPIFIPVLPPFSYYNSRYGLAVMPLFALAAAALVTVVPRPASRPSLADARRSAPPSFRGSSIPRPPTGSPGKNRASIR